MSMRFMRFPGGKAKALTFSYDDGVFSDKRLISIFDKNGIKGTFNINAGLFAPEGTVYPEDAIRGRMTRSQAYQLYKNSPHEVAIHGYTHPHLENIPTSQAVLEIITDRKALEEMFGERITGGAYPFGTYNDNIVEALRLCGIKYCRTIVSTENFDIPSDWLRLPATCHHDNPRLMELAGNFSSLPVNRQPKLFYVWGHSYEFNQKQNWNVIENFCEKMAHNDTIWYATNIEIYDYIEAYNH
ncbi:MAG: polysaccharide deacetylase family protein, partial [Clostridia bacterium]|nr:polysaccharide deacetylase family protein [Clostridia bacterium]